ncbi:MULTISPECIES: hypothetical protein [Paraburkholderia]|jgi:hypothetical protein|uniref:DUF2474 family protein n=1 Tax=Paraburkholderia phenazinium TaxID=60549 RepID=A0A1N6KD28_9BURK|nr:hypothetical protein [Paraburkholderia phenazinium]SIO54226.1 hypothetical protein SAMN05444168_6774 [Paraburkholderia phenazinium]
MHTGIAQTCDIKVRRMLWLVGLWSLGVSGALLLALPFEILIHLAMR